MANPADLAEIPGKVKRVYDACIQSKDVLYYPSEVKKEENALKTEIRLCESLTKKPGPKDAAKPKSKDVFDPENWDELLIDQFDGGCGEEYGLLLNKFAVVPMHFLLVTKHWEQQTSPLTPPQLLAAYQIILAFASAPNNATTPGGELLCFYNCGEMSGASQEHKHLQFAPMHGEGSLGHFPTETAADAYDLPSDGPDRDRPFSLDELPYANYVRRLDVPSETGSGRADPMKIMHHLQHVYLSLLDAMIDGLRALPENQENGGNSDKIKLGKGLSYNLLLTKRHMHVIPRKRAVYKMPVENPQKGEESPKAVTEPAIIGCNALAFTGTVLVKSQSDVKRLSELGGVLTALQECGYPKSHPPADISHDQEVID